MTTKNANIMQTNYNTKEAVYSQCGARYPDEVKIPNRQVC